MKIILIYVLVLALFAFIPTILDIFLAYLSANKTREDLTKKLIDKASLDKLDIKELREFLEASTKGTPGLPGLTRGLMALTVIVILGVAVFHILTLGVSGGTPENASSIVNNILSMLAGLLAAITGFYFGGKAAEKKQ